MQLKAHQGLLAAVALPLFLGLMLTSTKAFVVVNNKNNNKIATAGQSSSSLGVSIVPNGLTDSTAKGKGKTKNMPTPASGSTAAAGASATVAAVPKLAQRWRKSTKQVATLGPASSSLEMIENLFLSGADVFRLNFSHGSQSQKKELLLNIRQIEEKYSHPIAILGDLQGPKLRVGEFSNPDGELLEKGDTFRLDLDDAKGDKHRVKLPHPEIIKASEVGHRLQVDDGKVLLTVTGGDGESYLECRVDVAGRIKDRKGVNTPDSVLQISPLTPKDREDLAYMLKIGVDWVALSFVQTPADIEEIHALIDEHLAGNEEQFRPAVMAKIEKPSCFDGDNLERIVDLCQGIMVARGDLGVECPPEDVPLLQKTIIDECRNQGKPVVVATQMLESMIETPTPTRAEASDVATAIYDGADAIMLSAESAAGMYPEESVQMQQRIINRVEGDRHYRTYLGLNDYSETSDSLTKPTIAITRAARQIASNIGAKTIVSFTLTGSTVLLQSKSRPPVPILALCPFKEKARQLALSWGVYPDLPTAGSYGYTVMEEDLMFVDEENPVVEEPADDFDLVLRNACRAALKKGLVSHPEDLLVVTAGLPFGTAGAANIIRVVPASGPACWDGVCRVD